VFAPVAKAKEKGPRTERAHARDRDQRRENERGTQSVPTNSPRHSKNRGDSEVILGSDSNSLVTDSLGAEPDVCLPSR